MFFSVVDGREIVVSKLKPSYDIHSCGTQGYPCSTLEYAVSISKTHDTIVLECNQLSKCNFNVKKHIQINDGKDLTIKGSGDNPENIKLTMSIDKAFKLSGSTVKLRFHNITMVTRYTVGYVQYGESMISFEGCQIVFKMRRYSLGMPRRLKFFGAVRYAKIKLNFVSTTLTHYKFNRLRVLNLVLAGKEALTNEVYISKSKLSGNMMVTFKSDGTGSVRIIDSHFNSSAILIEGSSKRQTWSIVSIRNTNITNGHFSTQLKLSNMKTVSIRKLWVSSENSDSIRANNLDQLSIDDSQFPNAGMSSISTVTRFEAINNNYTMSSLYIRSCDRVNLEKNQLKQSTVTAEDVRFMQEHDGRYMESRLDLLRIETFIITSGIFNKTRKSSSSDAHSRNRKNINNDDDKDTLLLEIKDSRGVIALNTSFHQRQVRVENSRVTIKKSRFQDNWAVEGGAIYSANSTLTVEDTVFTNCSAKYFGGCIMNSQNGMLSLKNVQMISILDENRHPTLYGGAIYSTSPVKLLENVEVSVTNKSTSSPIIFIKSRQPSTSCYENKLLANSIDQFTLTCPKDHFVKHEMTMNEQNDFCTGNLFDFLSISCIKCKYGFVNPLTPSISYAKSSLMVTENVCQRCTELNYNEIPESTTIIDNQDHQCPLVVPQVVPVAVVPVVAAAPVCKNNHSVIYNPQCFGGNFHLSMLSNECIHARLYRINHAFVFWGALIVLASLYAMVLMYIKEIVVILCIKQIYLQLKVACQYFYSCCYRGKDTYIDDEYYQESQRADPMDEEFDLVMVHADQVRFTPLRFTMGTTTGMIKIIFFFYQMESLLRITWCPYKEQIGVKILSLIRDTISSLFSLRLNYHVKGVHLIPWIGFGPTDKEIMRATFGLWLLLPVLCIVVGHMCCTVQREHRAWRERNRDSYDTDSEEDSDAEEDNNEDRFLNETLNSEDSIATTENKYEEIRRPPGVSSTTSRNAGVAASIEDMKLIDYPPPKLKVQPMKYRFERIDGKVPIFVELPLKYRIKCYLLLLLTLLYLPISTLILKGIKCSHGDSVLEMENSTECYQGLQYICMVLIAFWVVPFPLAVFFGSKLQYTCNISPNEFFVILFCPPTSVFFYLRARLSQYRRTIKRPDAILAKHMLMTLYESFRLQKVDKRFDVMWDVAFLAQKLGMMLLVVFVPEAYRLYLVLAFLLFCTVVHYIVKPFNRDLTNSLQLISLVALLLLTLTNIFWYKQSECAVDLKALKIFQHIFLYLEYLVICAPVLIAILGILLAYVFAGCCMLMSRRHRNRDKSSSQDTKGSSTMDELDKRGSLDETIEEWHYPEEGAQEGGKSNQEKTRDKSLSLAPPLSREPKKRGVGPLAVIDDDDDDDEDTMMIGPLSKRKDEVPYRSDVDDYDEDEINERLAFTAHGQSTV